MNDFVRCGDGAGSDLAVACDEPAVDEDGLDVGRGMGAG